MNGEEESIPSDEGRVKELAMKSAGENSAMQIRVESAMKEEERMLTPAQGLDAMDALAKFDLIQKDGLNKVRKMHGGDTNGYRQFLARHGAEMTRRRNALARVVAAEARHGFEQSIKSATESDVHMIAERDIADGTATTLEQSLDADATNEAMNSSLSETDGWQEFMDGQIDRSEDMSKEDKDAAHGAIATAATGLKTTAAKVGLDALTAVSKQNEQRAREQAKPYIDDIRKIFLRRYKAQRTLRQSHDVAYATALEATRNASIAYFKERLGKGQFSDVMYMLDELEKHSDEMFDASKKEAVGGIYDPSNLAFLHHSDVNALRTAALTQLREFERTKRMKNAQTVEALKLQNAQIRFDADRLARSAVLDMDAIEKLFDRTQGLIDAGLPQAAETSSYLRGIVERAERKYSKAQKDADKLQTDEDFEREFKYYRSLSADAAIMAFYSDNGGDVINGRNAILTNNIDAKNRLILLVTKGLNDGVIKGERWAARLKQLHEQRAEDDYAEALRALSASGVTIDRDATVELFGASGDAQKKRSEAMGGEEFYNERFGKDSTGRLTIDNAKNLMFKWKIPTDKGPAVYASFSGEQLNTVLDALSRWQVRHPNPTEKEATEFINNVLSDAAKVEWKKHWFSANGYEFVGFKDVGMAAERRLQDYFSARKDRNGKPYSRGSIMSRDMRILEQSMDTGELVRQNDIIRMLRETAK